MSSRWRDRRGRETHHGAGSFLLSLAISRMWKRTRGLSYSSINYGRFPNLGLLGLASRLRISSGYTRTFGILEVSRPVTAIQCKRGTSSTQIGRKVCLPRISRVEVSP
jgi:hypothetical protein